MDNLGHRMALILSLWLSDFFCLGRLKKKNFEWQILFLAAFSLFVWTVPLKNAGCDFWSTDNWPDDFWSLCNTLKSNQLIHKVLFKSHEEDSVTIFFINFGTTPGSFLIWKQGTSVEQQMTEYVMHL